MQRKPMMRAPIMKRFSLDLSGQFAIWFGVLLIPLLAGVGTAVDYAGTFQVQSRLHGATDSAALFAAIEYAKTGKLPTVDDVSNVVSSNFNAEVGENVPKIVGMEIVNGEVVLKTEVVREVAFLSVLGRSNTRIETFTRVAVGKDEDLEIALVLDTTFSMWWESGASTKDLDPKGKYLYGFDPDVSRIEALKVSAKHFLDSIFEADAGKDKVRVAVVPFSKYVNVGMDKRGASWISVPNDKGPTGSKCEKENVDGDLIECHPETYTEDGLEFTHTVCTHEVLYQIEVCKPTGALVWHGCVGSRSEPLNLQDGSPTVRFKGIMRMDRPCAAEIQDLTNDKQKLLSSIDSLAPDFGTYIPEGVMWGTRVLSPIEPFTSVKVANGNNKVRKIMILMTDGDNMAVADLPGSYTHSDIEEPNPPKTDGSPNYYADRAKTDDWTLKACDQAKANDIEIFTISFGEDLTTEAKKIVKTCATDESHYFDAKNGSALKDAFQAIAHKFGGIYITG